MPRRPPRSLKLRSQMQLAVQSGTDQRRRNRHRSGPSNVLVEHQPRILPRYPRPRETTGPPRGPDTKSRNVSPGHQTLETSRNPAEVSKFWYPQDTKPSKRRSSRHTPRAHVRTSRWHTGVVARPRIVVLTLACLLASACGSSGQKAASTSAATSAPCSSQHGPERYHGGIVSIALSRFRRDRV